MIIEEKTEIQSKNEVISETFGVPMQKFEKIEEKTQEETQEVDLFSYDDFADEDLETQSFSFETENKIEETPISSTFSEEKPIEFSFFVNEPIENETSFEITETKSEEIAEPIQKYDEKPISNFLAEDFTPKTDSVAEVKNETPTQIVEEVEEPKSDTLAGFTFINKTAENNEAKVQERRNKLKEFNSRYQINESEDDFETVPAFRRKNIAIEGQNASEQRINSFLSENENGQMQVRENRFLNKDVD